MYKGPKVFRTVNRHIKKRLSLYSKIVVVLAVVLVTALLVWLPFTRSFLLSLSGADTTKGGAWFIPSATTITIFVNVVLLAGVLAYVGIDYRQHRKPLKLADPAVDYTLPHHIRIVTMPLLSYKWRALSTGAGVFSVVMLAFITTTLLTGVFTRAANTVSVTIEEKSGNNISTPVFEVTFSEPVDPSTFDASDITLTGLSGASVASITEVAPNDHTKFEVAVTSPNSGVVTMSIPAAKTTYAASPPTLTGSVPKGLVSDHLGNTYVIGQQGLSGITKITPDGTRSDFANRGIYEGNGVVDSNNNLYVVYATEVSKITPDGTVSTFAEVPYGRGNMAIDTSDNIYTANEQNNSISRIAPNGTVTTYGNVSDQPYTYANSMTVDTSGNVYMTYRSTDTTKIRKIEPDGTVSEFADLGGTVRSVYFAPDGYLYATNTNSKTIAKISTGGTVTTFATTAHEPVFITMDTSGNIFTIERASSGHSYVSKITPGGTVSDIVDYSSNTGTEFVNLVIRPTGDFYAISDDTNVLYDITSTGTVTPTGNPGSYPQDIARDDQGNVYTANTYSMNISKITSSGQTSILTTLPEKIDRIKYGPDGNLYAYYTGSSSVVFVIDTNGSTVRTLEPGHTLRAVVPDASGGIFSINVSTSDVYYTTSGGSVSTYDMGGPSVPTALTLGSDGNAYVAIDGTIKQVTPGGVITDWGTVPTNISQLTFGPSGALYALSGGAIFTKVPAGGGTGSQLASTGDTVYNFVIDADENIHFANWNNGALRTLEQDGSITTNAYSDQGVMRTRDGTLITSDGTIYGAQADFNAVYKAVPTKHGIYTTGKAGNAISTGSDTTALLVGVVDDFEVQDSNSSTMALKWNGDSVDLGSLSDYTYYNTLLEYKKQSDSTWISVPNLGRRDDYVLYGLDASTTYDLRIAYDIRNISTDEHLQTDWVTTTGTTTAQQTVHITNCDQLQAIGFNRQTFDPFNGVFELGDMSAKYVLDNDINCAGSENWTWLANTPYEYKGFMPIYDPINSISFSGEFDGQGHTIRNLTLLRLDDNTFYNMVLGQDAVGIFSKLEHATVKNVKLENITGQVSTARMRLSEHADPYQGGVGLLTGLARSSTITSVSLLSGSLSSAGGTPFESGPPYVLDLFSSSNGVYYRPLSMAVDSTGNTYILEQNGTVRKLNSSGVMVRQWELRTIIGNNDEPRNIYPYDIAVDGQDRVLITGSFPADNLGNTHEDKIQRYTTSGQYIDAIGSNGSGPGQFDWATSLATTSNYIYMVDMNNQRIQRLNTDGSNPISWPIDAPSEPEEMSFRENPNTLATDNLGHVFYMNIADQTVTRFDSDGSNEITFSTNATVPGSNWSNHQQPALAVDNAGYVYVSSADEPSLQRFNNDGTGAQNWAEGLWGGGTPDVNGQYAGFSQALTMVPNGSNMELFYYRRANALFDGIRMAGVMKLNNTGTKVDDWTNWLTKDAFPVFAGGLVGISQGSTITKSSSSASVTIASSPYQVHTVGGLVGLMIPSGGGQFGLDPYVTTIKDSYFAGAVNVNGGLALAGGLVGWEAGFYAIYSPNFGVSIENSYSAGSITATGSAKYIAAGGIGGGLFLVNVGDQLKNLFSTTAITGPGMVGADLPNNEWVYTFVEPPAGGFVGGLVGHLFRYNIGDPGSAASNNFADRQQTGQSECVNYVAVNTSGPEAFPELTTPPSGLCTAVNANGSQADYFKFNRMNGPLSTWNFSNIWRTNQDGLPTLGLNTPPSVPLNFGGAPTKTSVTLSWQTPADNGGRPIVDYTIQYRKAGESTWQTLSHDPSLATSYDISNLEAGTTYEFQVAAVNEIGASSFVLGTSVTTTEETPTTPTTPTNPTNPTNPTRPTRPGNTGGTPVATPNAEATRDTPIPGFPSTGGIAQLPEVEPAVVKRISTLERRIPFFFASLLLFVALAYAIMAYRDYKRSQVVMALVERERKDASNIKAFLSITTHYLRTPLTILEGALELFTANKVLAPTVLQTVQTEVKSLAVVISNIQTQNDSLESETRPGSLSSATSKTRLEDLVKAKRFWMPLIGVALLIAIADVIITVTGKYEIAELRLANTVALFAFGGLAIFIATYLQSRQSQTREQHKVLLENEQWLAQRKREMLGDAAEGLSTATASLKRVSQEFREVTHTQVYFNGLASLEKLARSLSNARDFSRVRTDAPLQNIQSVAASAVESLQAQIQQKGIVVQQQLDANAAIQAQPAEAQFLISSLVENAVKFSPEKGTVTIAAKSTKSGTTIRVTDHGPGIPADKLQNIMEPFSRGEPTETFDQEGLGLGLYTNKLLTEKLGGKLNITSGRGGGVVATVSLPTQTAESSGMVNGLITPTSSGV